MGVMHVDAEDRIRSFLEKPADPPTMPSKPDTALGSMGIYVFKTSFLIDQQGYTWWDLFRSLSRIGGKWPAACIFAISSSFFVDAEASTKTDLLLNS